MPRRKKTVPEAVSEHKSKSTSTNNAPKVLTPVGEKENNTVTTNKPPPKCKGGKIHAATRNKKKQNGNANAASKITMKVEGYAFKDDIIGVTHVRSDGDDAFNLTLRNMILSDSLEEQGFSSYVTLRDITSGKCDHHLCGSDGYPRYMFMSINVHKFNNAEEASGPVLEQCQHIHNVRFPAHVQL